MTCMPGKELASLRAQLDGIDGSIVGLLVKRMALVGEIGTAKVAAGSEVFVDHAREALVIRRAQEVAGTGLSATFVERIYREIMAEALSRQQRLRVGYLGPAGTFSQEAALARFGGAATLLPLSTISDCFAAVVAGHAEHAIVPYENSTEGSIGETIDQLAMARATVVIGETKLRVRQNLMAVAGTALDDVTRLYYHPQSYAQCINWLRGNLLPVKEMFPCSSNGTAAQRAAAAGQGAAALGPRAAAALNGLEVLKADVEDNLHNVTRFLTIGLNEVPPTGRDKTSLLIELKHETGSLYGVLKKFAVAGVNLTRLESRPLPGAEIGHYLFFVDLEGHRDEEPLRPVLAELVASTEMLKVLGSYPVATVVD